MKKLFTICLFFVILMLWIVLYPGYVYGANIENNPTVTNDSNVMCIEMFKAYDNIVSVILSQASANNRNALLSQFVLGRPYVYFLDNTTQNAIYLAVYENSTPVLGGYTIDIYNDNNSRVMVDGYKVQTIHTFKIDLSNKPNSYNISVVNNNEQLYVPAVTYNYFGDSILQMLKDLNMINESTDMSDIKSGIYTINSSIVSEGNQTQQAIGTMQNQITQQQQQTTNSINNMSNAVSNKIEQQQVQQQQQYDSFTNTTYYDNSTTVIDPDEFMGSVSDPNNTQDFLMQLYNKVYQRFVNPNRSSRVVIPMPHGLDDIVLDSSSIVGFYEEYSLIGDLVTVFWYFIIGRWVFAFVRRIYLFFVTGAFADTSVLGEYLSMHNEIIKTYMM